MASSEKVVPDRAVVAAQLLQHAVVVHVALCGGGRSGGFGLEVDRTAANPKLLIARRKVINGISNEELKLNVWNG
jgi:hypothetical protein